MSGRFEDIYRRAGEPLAPDLRRSDLLAEICRAIAWAPGARQAVQDAAERLARRLGASCLGIHLGRGGRLELVGLGLADRSEGVPGASIRNRWGDIPLDAGLPPALSARSGERLRWTADSPELDHGTREVLAALGAGVLHAIPALAEGVVVGCATVAVRRGASFSSREEAALGDAIGVLGLFYVGARSRERERERERGALQAHQLARAGELAAGIAHEVNNPLAAITHMAELLLVEPELPDPARGAASAILEEAGRAARTIERLQSFVRRGGRSCEGTALGELLEEVLALLRRAHQEAGVQLELEVAADLPRVEAPREALAGVLQELLANAREAAARSSGPRRVHLRATSAGDAVEVVLEDTGPGFAEATRSEAATPFFTTCAPPAGRGLGLSLAGAILRELGAELVLENWGLPPVEGGKPGEGGARVLLLLPVARPDQGLPAPSPRGEGSPPCAILLVEDEAAVARPLVKFLRRRGHDVTEVRSAEEALERIASRPPPDVILTDLRMPGLGGRGLFESLRDSRPELLPRLVFASGDVASAETQSFLRSTGRPWLAKPYPLKELERVIAEVTRHPPG